MYSLSYLEQGWEADENFLKKTGPGRMAETPRACTGDSTCRSWRYRCSIVLMRQGNLSMNGMFLISLLPPPDNRDDSPNMHNASFFLDCYLLLVTDGSIWIPYLARYSEIFKKPNFQVVKWKSTFIWKILSQAEWETEGSRLVQSFFCLPPLIWSVISWISNLNQ